MWDVLTYEELRKKFYDGLVDGNYLYNRCHLIGYQLTGENANTKNLITGTRYLNIEGMLPFENMVADYIQETSNHVLYRVTPIFEGNSLVANGVLMEGYSVEDKGAGVSYCVFAYNVQPGIEIDYATGESKLADGAQQEEQKTATVTPTPSPEPEKQEPVTGSEASQADYILNTNTKKFHYLDHEDEFEKLRKHCGSRIEYPAAKILDMCFFEYGFQRDASSQEDSD